MRNVVVRDVYASCPVAELDNDDGAEDDSPPPPPNQSKVRPHFCTRLGCIPLVDYPHPYPTLVLIYLLRAMIRRVGIRFQLTTVIQHNPISAQEEAVGRCLRRCC
jgi:hypothetical protein